ncbi:MAG TPA: hypothetical protein GXZ87_06525 [Bacteroidales bacterium]|nr:hypothetical protein [Bacteroidales bacterium]
MKQQKESPAGFTQPNEANNSKQCKDKKKPRYCKPESIKQLECELWEQKRIKYPNIPSECLAPIKHTDKTANGLTKAIIAFIKLKGGQAERINTTGRLIDRRKTYTDVVRFKRTIGSVEWVKGTTTPGSADISATVAGKSVKIEVKIGADRQSEKQKQYQSDIERAGGIYYIAKDFTSFVNWYNEMFERS